MKTNQKLTPTILIFFFLFLFLSTPIFSANWASIVQKVRPAIGKVTIQDNKENAYSTGTGFVIWHKGSQVLVTNTHVILPAIDNADLEIVVDFPTNTDEPLRQKLSILRYDKDMDIALLSLEKNIGTILALGTKNPPLMSEMVVIGYPLGESFKATPGFIQAYQKLNSIRSLIDMSATLAPGNSGGPVLNVWGQVIGIATSTIPGYNFNLAISIEDIAGFINQGDNKKYITITSDPPEAWVFVNEEFKGKTPLTIDLFNRSYALRIEKQKFEVIEETIGPWKTDKESLSKTLTPVASLDAKVTITTDPEGAKIYVNNRYIGISPVSVTAPKGRIIRIQVQKFGKKKLSENYSVTSEEEQELFLKLK